jgi:hypothetical protein
MSLPLTGGSDQPAFTTAALPASRMEAWHRR